MRAFEKPKKWWQALALLSVLWLPLRLCSPCASAARSGLHTRDRALQQQFTVVPEPVKLPWTPLFTDEEIWRGMLYGSGLRLQRVAQKLIANETIKVVFLGGSITNSADLERLGLSFSARFENFIRTAFPNRGHVFVDQGVPKSNSGWFASCVDTLVGDNADLVFVEFAVNDQRDAAETSIQRRSYEFMLRSVLRVASQPAVILLNHYSWFLSKGDGRREGLFFSGPESTFNDLAQYYDVTAMSMRAAAWRLMDENIDGFRVDKQTRGASGKSTKDYLYFDLVHPSPTGHQLLAELACAPIIRAVWEAASTLVITRRTDRRLADLPPPMIPTLRAAATPFCAIQQDFKRAVVGAAGFTYSADDPQAPTFKTQYWGYAATAEGSILSLNISTASGIAGDTRPAQVFILHQKALNLGTGSVSCVSGCSCQPAQLDSALRANYYVANVVELKATQSTSCRIRILVTSIGKKVKVTGVTVNF
ncbi:hypothetical protein ABPG75_008108 [Micractinium tetrahymenae]